MLSVCLYKNRQLHIVHVSVQKQAAAHCPCVCETGSRAEEPRSGGRLPEVAGGILRGDSVGGHLHTGLGRPVPE